MLLIAVFENLSKFIARKYFTKINVNVKSICEFIKTGIAHAGNNSRHPVPKCWNDFLLTHTCPFAFSTCSYAHSVIWKNKGVRLKGQIKGSSKIKGVKD